MNQKNLFFTHTYPAFCKLMKCKEPNERLSKALYKMYKQITNAEAGNFFEMSSSVAQNIFFKNAKKLQNSLNKEIKTIFTSEKHIILQQTKEIKLIEINSNNYIYTFIADSHKNIAILTNFYKPKERSTKNPLLTDPLEAPHHKFNINNNEYYTINTYNAFCNYAEYTNSRLTKELNKPFFNSAQAEITKKLQNLNIADTNAEQFNYIIFNNTIILYNFKLRPTIYQAY